MGAQFNLHGDRGALLFRDINQDRALQALWPLNESNNAPLDRALGNRSNGTLTGAPTQSVSLLNGQFYGFTFSGTGQYVLFGTPAALAFERTASFTMLAIVNPNNPGAVETYLSKYDGALNRGWLWDMDATLKPRFSLQNGAGNLLQSTANAALVNGTIYLLGITYDGSSTPAGLILYRNGVVDANTNNSNTLSATILNSAQVAMAAIANATFLLNGTLSFVAVLNRAATAEEMRRWAFEAGVL